MKTPSREIEILALTLLLVGCTSPTDGPPASAPKYVTPTKSVRDGGPLGSASVQGRWRLVAGEQSNAYFPDSNAVLIECHQATRSCQEAIAVINTLPSVPGGGLVAEAFEYHVTSWTTDQLRAVITHGSVAEDELLISFTGKTASRTVRRLEKPVFTLSWNLE